MHHNSQAYLRTITVVEWFRGDKKRFVDWHPRGFLGGKKFIITLTPVAVRKERVILK